MYIVKNFSKHKLKNFRINLFNMLWEEPRREPNPRSLRTELLLRCKGKCEECGLDFHKEGV
jgi:hypothetical protein